jgi:hypothetical protein
MASQWSDLKIQLMQTGENTGTWGNVTNANLGTAIEEAITGTANVTFSSADVTLTLTNTTATQSARNLRLNCTGTTGGSTRSLILGSGCQIDKVYIVNNGCLDTITVKNTTGTGIDVPAGKTMYVYNNGTNVVDAITHLTSLTLGTPLAVAQGGTGSTTGTFSGANITSLNATNIASGTLAVARGGTGASTLTADAVVIGNTTSNVKFVAPGTDGNVLTVQSGVWVSKAPEQGGGGTVSNVATSGSVNGLTLTGGPITTVGTVTLGGSVNVSTISTGVLGVGFGGTGANNQADARTGLGIGSMGTQSSSSVSITGGSISGVSLAGTGGSITQLNGSNISSGTVPTARLGSGSPSSSNFLCGDGSWNDLSNAFSQKSLGAAGSSGYQRFPGGLIMQWGFAGPFNGKGASQVITFPISFPNALLAAQLTRAAPNSTSAGDKSDSCVAGNPSQSNFTIFSFAENITDAYYSWVAIGW